MAYRHSNKVNRKGVFPISLSERPESSDESSSDSSVFVTKVSLIVSNELERDFVGRATTPVFLNEAERKRSITVVGKSVRVISRSLTADTNTNISVTGNQSGAQSTITVTVKADPSKL